MIKSTKNGIGIIVGVGVLLVLSFVFVLVLFDKDPTAYIGSLTALIGVLASTGVLASMIGKQKEQTDQIKAKTEAVAKSVNGNTSKLLDENAVLRARVAEYEANAGRHAADAPDLMSEDTITRIKADSDALTGPTPVIN